MNHWKTFAVLVLGSCLLQQTLAQQTKMRDARDTDSARANPIGAGLFPRTILPSLPPYLSEGGISPYAAGIRSDLLLREALMRGVTEEVPLLSVSLSIQPQGTERTTTLRTILGAVQVCGVGYAAYEHLRKFRHLYR